MITSFAISQEVNLQVVVWTLATAVYRTAATVARLAVYLVSWVPTLLAVLQVAGMTLACTAVIVAAVVATAMYPAVFVCGGALVLFALGSKPK